MFLDFWSARSNSTLHFWIALPTPKGVKKNFVNHYIKKKSRARLFLFWVGRRLSFLAALISLAALVALAALLDEADPQA